MKERRLECRTEPQTGNLQILKRMEKIQKKIKSGQYDCQQLKCMNGLLKQMLSDSIIHERNNVPWEPTANGYLELLERI